MLHEPLILRRSWWQRTFSGMKPDSMRSSVFALIATALGAGCFAIPSVIRSSGVILGSIILFASGYVSLLGMNNISYAADYYKKYDYALLVNKVLGKPYAVFLEALLAGYIFISLIAYQIIAYDCLQGSLHKAGIDIRDYYLIGKCLYTACILPLGFLRKLSGVSFFAMLSMGCVFYIATIIVIQAPVFAYENDYETHLVYFALDESVFSSICVCLFAFICHMNVASVYSEVPNPILHRMKKGNGRAVVFEVTIYAAIGVLGYLSTLEQTPDMFYDRHPPSSAKSDALMLVAQGLSVIVVSVALVCMILPCRHNFIRLIRRVHSIDKESSALHTATTLLLVLGSFVISIFIPQVIVVLQFLGALCPIFCNLFPAMLRASTEKHYWCLRNLVRLGIAGLVCVIAVVAVTLKCLRFFHN